MTDQPRGTLYIGVTSRLLSRVVQHREGKFEGFTARYDLKRLVWFEYRESMIGAIQREKSLKRWSREWKINLIERDNPHWDDLYPQLADWTPVPRQFRRPGVGWAEAAYAAAYATFTRAVVSGRSSPKARW